MMAHLEQAYDFDIRSRLYDDRAAPDGVVLLAEDKWVIRNSYKILW